jgi:3-hydroxymyristoyl/3-hydroxydecanoyl-(acyl carrier protein) dehydratase
MNQKTVFPSERWVQLLSESARRSSLLHEQFLGQRQTSLAGMKSLVELQLRSQAGVQQANAPVHAHAARPALFTSAQLDAFGSGRLSDCLGPAFLHYDQRRIPRIPNGDLKMMSRVVTIAAKAHQFDQPAEIIVEYDVPADAWYFRDNPSGEIPTALFMEIALQPCGFLSAYIDTYALVPHGEFYFRNLDGDMRFHTSMALAGQTIVTRAQLLSSVASSGTVIQKFAFSLSCNEQLLVEGVSVFGYFAGRTMVNQQGLDGGKQVAPWRRPGSEPSAGEVNLAAVLAGEPGSPGLRLPGGRMNMLERAVVEKTGGRYGKGYVYASRRNHPQDWYYPYHFYQDPVMPGSLGVEAMLQAMQIYAVASDLGTGLRSPRFGVPVCAPPMSWRYRGQITQQHQQFELEVHISDQQREPHGVTLQGDASLWIDGLRIYEARNAAIRILEA